MAMNGITAVHLHGKCGAKGFLWDLAENSMAFSSQPCLIIGGHADALTTFRRRTCSAFLGFQRITWGGHWELDWSSGAVWPSASFQTWRLDDAAMRAIAMAVVVRPAVTVT